MHKQKRPQVQTNLQQVQIKINKTKTPDKGVFVFGATFQIRTEDLRFTKPLLYQLS